MKPFRGIYAIVQTPFNADGDLIWEDFQRQCDWIARCGAHGLVWPVIASEFTVISHRERVEGAKLAVDAIAGRIPVMIGVADTSTAGAVDLAREAGKAGADSIIAMPPWQTKLGTNDLVAKYYRALADAAGVPVCIQNCGAPLGSSLSGKYVVELCQQIPLVQYLKEEKPPQGHSVQEVINLAGPEVKGVFSGASARYVIPEFKRGVCGNMPAAVLPDVDAQIWDLLEAGKEAEARRIMAAKALLESALDSTGMRRARKEVLVRRGVIANPYSRGLAQETLDAVDLAEIEYGLEQVAPYFRV
ncbi:MAG: dihydrodipicolinate synthase family protein [Chloroflexota bacterium]